MFVIQTKGLTKKFKQFLAVSNVNIEVRESECFGLLGPNGAGKTSLIRMITAVSPPTSGDIQVLGKNLKTNSRYIKSAIGVVPQLENLDPDLNVLQNLTTFARYYDIPKNEALKRSQELLSLFELDSKSRNQIKELSGGMKRRLLIARGLINKPKILILDEPTIGLDPQGKYLVWAKLVELKSKGVTLLISTQNMEEATELCDRVSIMHRGKILTIGIPKDMVAQYVGKEVWEIDIYPVEMDKTTCLLKEHGIDFEVANNKIYIFNDHDTKRTKKVIPNSLLRRRPATLEDVFFRLTGRSLVE